MSKKIVKLAVIRKNDADPCPFGLSIPFGCDNAGEVIDNMAPIDILGPESTSEEKAEIIQANNHLLKWKSPGQPCKYAGQILENKEAVECNWDTEAAGDTQHATLRGSPLYYKHFSGVGLDGLYSYPLGYYTDNSIDRGMYYGMYSIESISSQDTDVIGKEAEDLDKSANKSEYMKKSLYSKGKNESR